MERQEKGQGSVFHVDGVWIARLRYTDDLGNRKEKSWKRGTEKEAKKELEAFKQKLIKGDVASGRSITLGEWLEEAMETIYRHKLRPNTYALYEGFMNHHLKPLWKVQLNKLTPGMCDSLISGLKKVERRYEGGSVDVVKDKPLSGQSKVLVRRFLIGALNHAVRLGYLKENPAQRSLPPMKVVRKMRVLTMQETKQLLETVDSDQFRAIFTIQLYLGLRIGEVMGIRWTDLEEADGQVVLHIRQQVQRNRILKQVVSAPLKTEQAQRSLLVPTAILDILGKLEGRGEYVFSSKHGKPLEPRVAQRALERYAEKAGLGKVTSHSLRRTSASLHLQAGTGLGILKDILGHTDIRTTTLYAKSSLAANADANERLGRLLGS